MTIYYPVYLNLSGRKCVVIGGCAEAEKKAKMLLECGAEVIYISPQVTPGIEKMARERKVTWHAREYGHGDLAGAFLAICTETHDRNLNTSVREEASELNVVLNVVDVTDLCDFIAPSIVRRGSATFAMSSQGTSPALARRLREELDSCQGHCDALAWAEAGPVLAEVRAELRSRGVTPRSDEWQANMNHEILMLVDSGKTKEARELLLQRLMQTGATSG